MLTREYEGTIKAGQKLKIDSTRIKRHRILKPRALPCDHVYAHAQHNSDSQPWLLGTALQLMITSQKTIALMSGLCSLIPSIKWPSIVVQGIERRSNDMTKTQDSGPTGEPAAHTYPLNEETRHSDNVCDHS